jgi:cell division protein FtsI/penicillin-binding protein 2
MGQEVAATPLQIIAAYGALANGGTLKTPRLVVRESRDPESVGSGIVSHVVDGQVAETAFRLFHDRADHRFGREHERSD